MNFALIAEGITDRPIIQAVLAAFFEKEFAGQYPFINPLQPKQKEPGGWVKVLDYCTTDELKGAFVLNDYIIIQIDSDRHADKGYDVQKCPSTNELIQAIQKRIIEKIGEDFYTDKKDKILFAVCVDMIECWLLPFYATTAAHQAKEQGCCGTLNLHLKKKGYTLDCTKDSGGTKEYEDAAKGIARKKVFYPAYKKNTSLQYFVDKELKKVTVTQS
jgi:hypothetical protein